MEPWLNAGIAALPRETRNQIIISVYLLKRCMLFCQQRHKLIQKFTWSQLNRTIMLVVENLIEILWNLRV